MQLTFLSQDSDQKHTGFLMGKWKALIFKITLLVLIGIVIFTG